MDFSWRLGALSSNNGNIRLQLLHASMNFTVDVISTVCDGERHSGIHAFVTRMRHGIRAIG